MCFSFHARVLTTAAIVEKLKLDYSGSVSAASIPPEFRRRTFGTVHDRSKYKGC